MSRHWTNIEGWSYSTVRADIESETGKTLRADTIGRQTLLIFAWPLRMQLQTLLWQKVSELDETSSFQSSIKKTKTLTTFMFKIYPLGQMEVPIIGLQTPV